MKKINLLFLTSHLPYPLISGGRLREHELIVRLSKYCNVYLCVVTKTYESDMDNVEFLVKHCKEIKIFKSPDNKLCNTEDDLKIPPQIKRNNSIEARKYIFNIIRSRSVEIVHMEGFYMHQLLPDICNCLPIVLIEQNIEYLLFKQQYEISKDYLEKQIIYEQFNITEQYEHNVWHKVDSCILLTDYDQQEAQKYINKNKVKLIPNGADHLLQQSDTKNESIEMMNIIDKNYILYIGNFDYQPNVDAAIYLIESIFSKIKTYMKNLKLYIVGNSGDKKLEKYKMFQDVTITGRVPSLIPYFKNAKFCVFPLRVGGGIKVKILEALQYQKIVVTTSIGAQGIPVGKSNAIIVNDNESDMIQSIISLCNEDEVMLRDREKTCMDIISALPSWDHVVEIQLNEYNRLIQMKSLSKEKI